MIHKVLTNFDYLNLLITSAIALIVGLFASIISPILSKSLDFKHYLKQKEIQILEILYPMLRTANTYKKDEKVSYIAVTSLDESDIKKNLEKIGVQNKLIDEVIKLSKTNQDLANDKISSYALNYHYNKGHNLAIEATNFFHNNKIYISEDLSHIIDKFLFDLLEIWKIYNLHSNNEAKEENYIKLKELTQITDKNIEIIGIEIKNRLKKSNIF